MNRRQILKSALLAPLLGLFKSKKPTGLTVDKLMKCKAELDKGGVQPDEDRMIDLTSGTSNEGKFLSWDKDGNECLVSYERAHKIEDIPIGFWKAI